MKVKQLFKKRSLLVQFTTEQAAANRAYFEQELGPLDKAASYYFMDFWVGDTKRSWLLCTEGWRDLRDEQVDFVLKHLAWFKAEIGKVEEKLDEELPYEWSK